MQDIPVADAGDDMHDAQHVSGGTNHTLILKKDGTGWSIGSNTYGQLGDGTTITRDSPVQILYEVKTIDGGNTFSLFLKNNGTLWACGSLGTGSLVNQATPKQVIPPPSKGLLRKRT